MIQKNSTNKKNTGHRISRLAMVIALAVFSFLLIQLAPIVHAATVTLTIRQNGWTQVGDTDVYIPDMSQFSVNKAVEDGNFAANGNFFRVATVTANDWNSLGSTPIGDKLIVAYASNSSTTATFPSDTETSVSGSFTLNFPGIARYFTGQNSEVKNADILMRVTNVRVQTTGGNNTGIILLADYYGTERDGTLAYYNSRRTDSERSLGARYNVSFVISDSETGEVLNNKKIVFGVTDLDHCDLNLYNRLPDATSGTCGKDASGYYGGLDDSILNGPYAEGVDFISGVSGNTVYVENDTYLKWYTSPYNSDRLNTRFVGTKDARNGNVAEARRSGVIAQMEADYFVFTISGFNVMTENGFIPPSTVETKATGTYRDKVLNLTVTDDEVLWKKDKEVTFSAASGFYPSKLLIDGQEVPVSNLTYNSSTNTFSYAFQEVTYDHVFEIQVQPIIMNFCKIDENNEPLYGAAFQLTLDRDEATTFSPDTSSSDVTINNNGFGATVWSRESNGGCVRLGFDNLEYGSTRHMEITEVSVPDGYYPAYDAKINFSFNEFGELSAYDEGQSAIIDHNTISIVNTPIPLVGSLNIQKIVRGDLGDTNKNFQMTLTITNRGSDQTPLSGIAYTVKNSSGTTVRTGSANFDLDNSYSFSIKHGETIYFALRNTNQYRIDENNYSSDGYTTTYTNRTGTVNNQTNVSVINTKEGIPVTGVDIDTDITPYVLTISCIAIGALVVVIYRRCSSEKT